MRNPSPQGTFPLPMQRYDSLPVGRPEWDVRVVGAERLVNCMHDRCYLQTSLQMLVPWMPVACVRDDVAVHAPEGPMMGM